MEANNQDLNILLRKFEGKKILILTKFNIHYQTNNLKVFQDSVSFVDKFGCEVILAISEIAQVTEVSSK